MNQSGIKQNLSFHKASEELFGMIGKLMGSTVSRSHEYKHNNIQGVIKNTNSGLWPDSLKKVPKNKEGGRPPHRVRGGSH